MMFYSKLVYDIFLFRKYIFLEIDIKVIFVRYLMLRLV